MTLAISMGTTVYGLLEERRPTAVPAPAPETELLSNTLLPPTAISDTVNVPCVKGIEGWLTICVMFGNPLRSASDPKIASNDTGAPIENKPANSGPLLVSASSGPENRIVAKGAEELDTKILSKGLKASLRSLTMRESEVGPSPRTP